MRFLNIQRISRPGRRVYIKSAEIPIVRSGSWDNHTEYKSRIDEWKKKPKKKILARTYLAGFGR